jgi:hypothetical protein
LEGFLGIGASAGVGNLWHRIVSSFMYDYASLTFLFLL